MHSCSRCNIKELPKAVGQEAGADIRVTNQEMYPYRKNSGELFCLATHTSKTVTIHGKNVFDKTIVTFFSATVVPNTCSCYKYLTHVRIHFQMTAKMHECLQVKRPLLMLTDIKTGMCQYILFTFHIIKSDKKILSCTPNCSMHTNRQQF